MQLDLFADSSENMLLNDVVRALRQQSFFVAEIAIAKLSAEFPSDSALPSAKDLLALREFPAVVFSHEQLRDLIAAFETRIEPAAQRLFSSDAKPWMKTFVWRRLASVAAGLPYSVSHPTIHAAATWVRAQEWQAAIECIRAIPSWRRMPVLLEWMCLSMVRSGNLDEAWPLLMELAWMAPLAFSGVVRNLHDLVLLNLLKEFEALFDDNGDDQLYWFPALAVTVKPALQTRVRGTAPAKVTDATNAFECVCNLLLLEKQGRQQDIVMERARLRSLNDQLYSRYMQTR